MRPLRSLAILLVVIAAAWANAPALGCDGRVVRGLIRLECITEDAP